MEAVNATVCSQEAVLCLVTLCMPLSEKREIYNIFKDWRGGGQLPNWCLLLTRVEEKRELSVCLSVCSTQEDFRTKSGTQEISFTLIA